MFGSPSLEQKPFEEKEFLGEYMKECIICKRRFNKSHFGLICPDCRKNFWRYIWKKKK